MAARAIFFFDLRFRADRKSPKPKVGYMSFRSMMWKYFKDSLLCRMYIAFQVIE